MPKMALADTLREWDSLLAGMDDDEALQLPHLRELRDELSAMIESTRALVAEQSSLEGRRQAITQQLRITRQRGQDLVIKVRASLKAELGHRNEGLVRFHMRPVRRRSRAKTEETGVAVYPRPDLLPPDLRKEQPTEAVPVPEQPRAPKPAGVPPEDL